MGKRTARLCTVARVGKPYENASGALNSYVHDYLVRAGFSVDLIHPSGVDILPLQTMSEIRRLIDLGEPDVSVYCDFGLMMDGADIPRSKKDVVFFHGLMGGVPQWMTRSDVGVLCGNSGWTRDTIVSITAFPVWQKHSVNNPSVFNRALHVRYPLPMLESPEGAGAGKPVPESFLESLEQSSDILAFDFQFESDDKLHAALLVMLNAQAQEHGEEARFRLIVPQYEYSAIQAFADEFLSAPEGSVLRDALARYGRSLLDLYTALPGGWIRQCDVFRVMRASAFGLSFNSTPESFGLMPLESVCCGTPVYTNGSGNLRYLLPEGCGIVREDTEGLAQFSIPEISRVAARIRDDLARPGSDGIDKQVARGEEYIRKNYSVDAFSEDFGRVLGADPAQQAIPTMEELKLDIGPLVRTWNSDSRFVISDHRHVVLSDANNGFLREWLGRPAADIFRLANRQQREAMDRMWEQGLLTWKRDTRGYEVTRLEMLVLDPGSDRFARLTPEPMTPMAEQQTPDRCLGTSPMMTWTDDLVCVFVGGQDPRA